MKIRYNGKDLDLHFNENGAMFYVTDKYGDVVEWLCSRHEKAGFNQCWLDRKLLVQMEIKAIVKHVEPIQTATDPTMMDGAILCDIIHPEFNDDGYSGFGDFARSRLGQQCQYASRYIDGRLEGYPALGEGLRFNNGKPYGKVRELDASDYHSVRIHRDDMDEFERRYKEYRSDNGFGMRTEVLEWLIGK